MRVEYRKTIIKKRALKQYDTVTITAQVEDIDKRTVKLRIKYIEVDGKCPNMSGSFAFKTPFNTPIEIENKREGV